MTARWVGSRSTPVRHSVMGPTSAYSYPAPCAPARKAAKPHHGPAPCPAPHWLTWMQFALSGVVVLRVSAVCATPRRTRELVPPASSRSEFRLARIRVPTRRARSGQLTPRAQHHSSRAAVTSQARNLGSSAARVRLWRDRRIHAFSGRRRHAFWFWWRAAGPASLHLYLHLSAELVPCLVRPRSSLALALAGSSVACGAESGTEDTPRAARSTRPCAPGVLRARRPALDPGLRPPSPRLRVRRGTSAASPGIFALVPRRTRAEPAKIAHEPLGPATRGRRVARPVADHAGLY
ncbi:hypothetical protein WOLCODRAFT_153067 [Wolfiporia cocos MD-104 SS10]|uniref:Uncharacterized protein n=1 Tax=Wolfiporia cocos (strain MD-104) TaxID=742152 RepID=A0A2H3JYQ9_WOLCO|nr:hypothetical protein WOLCODRAFT_153067 [Wolfiporia cocos MD-104 SS10]